jgi:hypothetical protein
MALLIKTLPPLNVYTIHKAGSPLIWLIREHHTVVTCLDARLALNIASITESHYRTHKEWPSALDNGGSLSFSYTKEVSPTILGVQEVPYRDYVNMCSMWNLHLLVMADIKKIEGGRFSFIGDICNFTVPIDLHRNHLESLIGAVE